MMKQKKCQGLFITLILIFFTTFVYGDVKEKSMTKMDFKGSLGTIMKIMGAEKPQYTVTYLKGNVLRTDKLDKKGKKVKESDIIDLDRELFIHIRHKKKKYSQMTFTEWKEMLAKAMEQLNSYQTGEQTPDKSKNDETAPEVKWDFKVDVETPGDKETIAGHPTEKVILKMTVEAETMEKAKGEDENQEEQTANGGLNVTSTQMLCKDIQGDKELQDFHRRLADKLGMNPQKGGLANILLKVMQSNPQLGAAMKKMQEEGKKLNGVPLRSHTVFATWGEQSQQMKKDDEQNNEIPTSMGGLFKKFGHKKKKPKGSPNDLLETTSEVNLFETSPLSADLFTVPANYKLEKRKN